MTPCGNGLYYSAKIQPQDLQQLLYCMRAERGAHSWRNFALDGSLDELQKWENALRPTTLFFYYEQEGPPGESRSRLLGAASVADKIHRDFPHSGFPILARCFILPAFRGHGLYRRIVQQRLDFCHSRFGDDLKAIHLGTADPRVVHHITARPGAPVRFLRIGSQVVRAGDEDCLVGAFLHVTPTFTQALVQPLQANAPPLVRALQECLAQLLAGAPGEHALTIAQGLAAAQASGGLADRNVSALMQLLALCRAIPLVGLP